MGPYFSGTLSLYCKGLKVGGGGGGGITQWDPSIPMACIIYYICFFSEWLLSKVGGDLSGTAMPQDKNSETVHQETGKMNRSGGCGMSVVGVV